ncbi:phosphatidylglycerol lysyltransferase domain-containing protein [Actinoallomurus rhizosphaericola]|uniref:phosphatidylglycerol lysyltransferase domain-containing protein n=1 Tax=Actinoallomurus rhizosphaericola TaxID=2952536 RepID=UPI002093F9EC|nr:phosphatidylglycerol lysyltransferase domain-containing protein [Actinoallomurus rhizosphaericola]MCO6000056.1 phosphatidylglycerol lysyltransferase domain-containing protein [Actinoallomurus rhizosphaericola]
MGTKQDAPVRPEPGGASLERRLQRRWVPAVTGWLSFLIGLHDVVGALLPEWHRRMVRLDEYVPGSVNNAARTATLVAGLLLLLLSHALRRRKRRAWRAVVGLLAFTIVSHVVKDFALSAIVAAAMLGALLYFRDEFYATGDPRTRWRALWVGSFLAAASVGVGLLFITVNRHGLVRDYSFSERLWHVVGGLFGVTGPVTFVSERRNDLFGLILGSLGLFTGGTTAFLFLRPAEPAPSLSAEDEERIRALLSRQGHRDSLGYFSLRRDKSVIWSPTGKACVTYRVVSGVMLAGGDPIGDPEAWPGAIQAFLEEAARHAWAPAVMGCSELGAEVWCRDTGLSALELGDEAIVDAAEFSLEGRTMRNVRQMVNRVARQGYTAEVRREKDFAPEELRALWAQADAWRGTDTERGFSMALGRVGESGDEECVVATAKKDGELHAILHFVPWGADGLSLDLMRRDRSAQPGLNDFLIVEALKAAPDLGVKRISLNFAVFRAALARGERIGAGPVLKAWRGLLIFLSRWFQIESLYKFNAKFQPVWQPRFFVYPSLNDAPRIALAALEAEAFIVWPRLRIPGLKRP